MTRQRIATRILLTWLALAPAVFADATPQPLVCQSHAGLYGATGAFRKACIGIDELRRRLVSTHTQDRKMAYLRVEARGDETAWRLLKLSLERPGLELDAEEELMLARVAASHSQLPIVRSVLVHLAYAASAHLDAGSPARQLALQIAVMALAQSETPEALVGLCRMLQQEGVLSASARSALSHFPPRPFARLFDAALPRSPGWARLLGESRHREAIPILRRVLLAGTLEMQLAAATALVELEDAAMLPLIEQWKGDPDAPEEFKAWVREPRGIESANLGRQRYAFDTRATDAVTNFASNPDRSRLDPKAPTHGDERQMLLTAALLCHFRQCRSPQLSLSYWEAQLSDKDAHARFVAAAILSKLAPDLLSGALKRHELSVERAVGWALPYLAEDSPLMPIAAAALAGTEDPSSAYCGALVHESVRNSLRFAQLLRLAFTNGDCAALAAEAVGQRAPQQWRLTLLSLLNSERPSMRAATARGLGRNTAPFASGLLYARYLREGVTLVRRAIVRAFGLRGSRLGLVELAKTGHLDPDPVIRSWVTRTLRGERIEFQPGDPLGALEYDQLHPSTPMVFALARPTETRDQPKLPTRICGVDACSMPIMLDPTGQLLVPTGGAPVQLESADSVPGQL